MLLDEPRVEPFDESDQAVRPEQFVDRLPIGLAETPILVLKNFEAIDAIVNDLELAIGDAVRLVVDPCFPDCPSARVPHEERPVALRDLAKEVFPTRL
jgi:hypothetical protein